MSKLGKDLIEALQEALRYQNGEKTGVRVTVRELKKYEGTNREVAAPGGKTMRDPTSNIGAGETMGKEEAEKCGDRVEITPDGKREFDVGVEALDKKPKKKKLVERWEEIKKGLDNKSAILDLDSLSEDEEQPPEDDSGAADTQENPESDEDGGAVPDDQQEDADARPEWLPEDVEHEGETAGGGEGQEDEQEDQGDNEAAEAEIEEILRQMGHSEAEIRYIIHGHMVPQVDPVDRAKVEHEHHKIEHDNQAHEKEMAAADDESAHEKALRDKELAARSQEMDTEAEHAKRMKDLEYQRAQKESGETDLELEHKKRLQDLEFEKEKAAASFNEVKLEADHKKRMLDLEYENAKATKALELQFKEKEHAMKLKHAEQLAQEKQKAALQMTKDDATARKQEKKMEMQQRTVDKKEDLKLRAKQSEEDRKLAAKQTAEDRAKEKAKTVKKSDADMDDLQKAVNWKHSKSMVNGVPMSSIAHPEHGIISVRPGKSGFDMLHNGKNLGNFSSHGELKGALTDYMNSLSGPVEIAHPKPKLSVVPNAPEEPRLPPVAKPPIGTPKLVTADLPHKRKLYDPELSGTVSKIDAQASRGEEWRNQQKDNGPKQSKDEPHSDEPADEESKGEKSNIEEAERKDAKMQLGVSTVNSRNQSKYRGDKENVK